jgi:hypothetical protein
MRRRVMHGMVYSTMVVMHNPVMVYGVVDGMMNLSAGKTGQSDEQSNGH